MKAVFKTFFYLISIVVILLIILILFFGVLIDWNFEIEDQGSKSGSIKKEKYGKILETEDGGEIYIGKNPSNEDN